MAVANVGGGLASMQVDSNRGDSSGGTANILQIIARKEMSGAFCSQRHLDNDRSSHGPEGRFAGNRFRT